MGNVFELVGPVHELISQETDFLLIVLDHVVSYYFVVAAILHQVPVCVSL